MKIAVTAASGQLGSSIIRQLIKEIGADHVVGLARTPANVKIEGIEVRKGDYSSNSDFEESLEGVDSVLIVVGNAHPDDRIGQHQNIIQAAKSNGVKKVVYTSIYGAEKGNAFSPIVNSNRQTEEDVRNSGLNWTIGRNGIYIEPDLEYIETYKKEGAIINCAADGKCCYTSRTELAEAYTRLLLDDPLNEGTYSFLGPAISQQELADKINEHFGLSIGFKNITADQYRKERQDELGEFLGGVITGIYVGIRDGKYDGVSNFEKVAGRPHKSVDEMMEEFKRLTV